MLAIGKILVGNLMTVGAFSVLMIAAVRTVAIVGFNFFRTLNTARLLYSTSRLKFRVKDKPLGKLDNAKAQGWNQQNIDIAD